MTLPAHVAPPAASDPLAHDQGRDRRAQILHAAMLCFARRGFHQTTMHDIAAEARISVGLIYRYFESKEAVITVMAAEHKRELQAVLDRAHSAPSLFEALEILFTCHCPETPSHVHASFVVDLFAESARNPTVAALIQDVINSFLAGVETRIAAAPEAQNTARGFTPRQAAELIVDTAHGGMMRDITDATTLSPAQRQQRQIALLRSLWALLFPASLTPEPALP